jgi:hypothetical protein
VRFEAEIESTSWAPSSVEDFDTSFGLELFVDNCHYGIHLVGNGHLGILHPSPSQLADCMGPIGDPEFQTYVVVPDWDTLRASSPLRLRLTWRQTGVDLEIVAGAETRTVSYLAPEIPGNGSPPIVSLPMPIRLNVNYNQSYRVRYVDICAL